jgi:hypothetical protein
MERNFIVGAVVVCAIAFAAAVGLRTNDERDAEASGTDSTATRIERAPRISSTTASEKSEGQPLSAIEQRRDEALHAHVEHKYRYLLTDVDGARRDELKRRLLELESEENITSKAATDARVRELLSPREREYYDALKDSDAEQHHVAEYVGGVGNIEPLDPRQERQVLDAKLRQKQRYAAAVRDAGLDRDTLSVAERAYANAQVAEALKNYLDDFLMEVSPSLTSEQYALLRNYETTEFQRELERLQRQINSK